MGQQKHAWEGWQQYRNHPCVLQYHESCSGQHKYSSLEVNHFYMYLSLVKDVNLKSQLSAYSVEMSLFCQSFGFFVCKQWKELVLSKIGFV